MESEAPPTNDVLFSALTAVIRGRQCIAVIGAGVSALDYPLWQSLIGELQRRCGLRSEDPESTDPLDVAEAARKRNKEEYFKTLDELFCRKEKPKARSLYRYHMLARIPFSSYITMNFDPLLLDTIDLHRDVTVSDYPALKPQHLGENELFYIHGRLGPDRPAEASRIVLTRSEFEEAYHPDLSPLHGFLQTTMLNHDVCFIGCNPAEPHLGRLFTACETFRRATHDLADANSPQWFLLCDNESVPPPALHRIGIHVVRYPKLDKRYTGMGRVLEHWAEKQKPTVREPGVERSLYRDDVEPGK